MLSGLTTFAATLQQLDAEDRAATHQPVRALCTLYARFLQIDGPRHCQKLHRRLCNPCGQAQALIIQTLSYIPRRAITAGNRCRGVHALPTFHGRGAAVSSKFRLLRLIMRFKKCRVQRSAKRPGVQSGLSRRRLMTTTILLF